MLSGSVGEALRTTSPPETRSMYLVLLFFPPFPVLTLEFFLMWHFQRLIAERAAAVFETDVTTVAGVSCVAATGEKRAKFGGELKKEAVNFFFFSKTACCVWSTVTMINFVSSVFLVRATYSNVLSERVFFCVQNSVLFVGIFSGETAWPMERPVLDPEEQLAFSEVSLDG